MNCEFVELDNGQLNVRSAADGSRLEIKSRYGSWSSEAYISMKYGSFWYPSLDPLHWGKTEVVKDGNGLLITIKDMIWYARFPGHGFLKPVPAPEMIFSFRIDLEGDEVIFTTRSPEGLDDEEIFMSFPDKILSWKTNEPGELAGAFGNLGTLYKYPSAEKLNFETWPILPVTGFFTPAGGMGIRTAQVHDSRIVIETAGDAASGSIVHVFNKDKSEYDRTVRMRFFPAGTNYVDLAKWHRAGVKQEKRFISLEEKIAADPEVEKLAGSVIWKHNTYPKELPPGVEKDYSLYVRSREAGEAEGRPGNRTAKEVFDTAHAAGFDRVCILNTGWNHSGFDSGYPTRFPVNPERGTVKDFTEAAEYGRNLSPDYIFSVHDNYRHVYPNSPEFTFDELIHNQEGGRVKGGIWRGGRCYIICTECTQKYAERDLPRIAEMVGRGAIYLDVQGCNSLLNCYHPGHPGSRRTDAEWRLNTFRIAKKHIGAVATEGAPHEFAVQDIDLGAYPPIGTAASPDSNKHPIPFFQLVYHDSVYTFCGQGVSGVHGFEYVNRVALYGMLPWDFGKDSARISREMRQTCKVEMLSHEFCSEKVEHTVFADGTEVYANFGDAEEMGVPARSFIIKNQSENK